MVDAALKGWGIVQLPDDYIKEQLSNGSLITLLDNYRVADEGIWAIYPQNRHLSPKIS